MASGPHTVAWARRQGFTGTTGEELAAAYAAGDPVARAAIARTGEAVGRAIASATALLDLELVAIGGGFSHATPDLFDHMRAVIAAPLLPVRAQGADRPVRPLLRGPAHRRRRPHPPRAPPPLASRSAR